MKMTLGKKITVLFFIPLLIIISVLSMLIFSTISQYVNNWVQLEIRGITEINATDLAGQIDSVRIAVLSIANILESVDGNSENARERVSNVLHSMLINDAIYNVWVVYEPQAFDGNDDAHRYDYPGAPSGRFIRSYVKQDGEIVVAPDMDDVSIDDPELSPWYTRPRDSGQLYIDLDNENVNIWNYGLDEDPIYTLSIVSPIFRDGQVIGAIGADIEFDSMVISIDGGLRSTVAVFYSNGRIFYSPDLKYAEESIYTLGFSDPALIRGSFDSAEPLFLPDEYCIFTDTMGVTFFQPVPIRNYDQGGLFLYVSTPRTVIFERLFPVFLIIAATIPTGVIGILFRDVFAAMYGLLSSVGVGFLATGAILIVAERIGRNEKSLTEAGFGGAIFVGACQGIAIWPGLSRSGTTIFGSLVSGLTRGAAVKFAFLISIPAIMGSAIVEAPGALREGIGAAMAAPVLVGMTVAAISGFIAIKTMITVVSQKKLFYFSIYTWILGISVLIYALFLA